MAIESRGVDQSLAQIFDFRPNGIDVINIFGCTVILAGLVFLAYGALVNWSNKRELRAASAFAQSQGYQ